MLRGRRHTGGCATKAVSVAVCFFRGFADPAPHRIRIKETSTGNRRPAEHDPDAAAISVPQIEAD